MSSPAKTMVTNFDELVAASDVLCAGAEGPFAQFVGCHADLTVRVQVMTDENARLQSDNEANAIKLKHARSSFDYQMQKRVEAEEQLKEYQRQFAIISELLADNKLNTLNPDERRSLAFLKGNRRSSTQRSPGSFMEESSAVLSPSEVSIDPLDLDAEVSFLRSGTKWKRRRTASVEDKVGVKTSPPPNKKKRSNDGAADYQGAKRSKSSLSPQGELFKVPALEKKFKKPPPNRNRRKPSKGHLHHLAYHAVDAVVSASTQEDDSSSQLSDTDAPSAPPLSPHIYPNLPSVESKDLEAAASPPTPTAPFSPSPAAVIKSHSDMTIQRRHTFFTKTIIKVETCQVCHKRIKFGKNCLKCRDCRTVCHPECKAKIPMPCVPSVPTPKKNKLHGTDLSAVCPQTVPRVPALVVHCVNEIERRGLTEVGIYRVPGSDKVVKEVRERLVRIKGNPGLDKVRDVNVLCGVLKDFLRSLREPLLTFRLHKAFFAASEAANDEDGLAETLEAIAELPPANKDTLAFMILHLQKVAAYSDANKMPIVSLSKVFGPTIVGHGCANPEPSQMWQDTQKQPKVMQRLLEISPDYWRQYLSPVDNPEPGSPGITPTPSSHSSPAVLSPATPELRPVPESPFLGSCQSPRRFVGRTPLTSRSAANVSSVKVKRGRNFFAAIN